MEDGKSQALTPHQLEEWSDEQLRQMLLAQMEKAITTGLIVIARHLLFLLTLLSQRLILMIANWPSPTMMKATLFLLILVLWYLQLLLVTTPLHWLLVELLYLERTINYIHLAMLALLQQI